MPKPFSVIDPSVVALNSILVDQDVTNFAEVAIQIAPFTAQALPGAGAIIFEGSNDRLTWGALPYTTNAGVLVATGILAVTANALVKVSTPWRYFRIRISTLITAPPANAYITALMNEVQHPASAQDQVSPAVSITGTVTLATNTPTANAGGIASGLSINRLVSAAANTNPVNVKGSGGRVYGIEAFNTSASVKFLKLYNKATAPVPGTDTPVMTLALAVGQNTFRYGDIGITFLTGIGFGLTGLVADNDATALAAGDVVALNVLFN